MKVAKELYPVRAGFELAYRRQLIEGEPSREAIEEVGPIVSCLIFQSHPSWSADGRLLEALGLFTGRSSTSSRWDISAQCVDGICAFLGILRDVSVHKDALRKIYVLPRRINLEGKSYFTLEDDSHLYYRRKPFPGVLAQGTTTTESGSIFKLRVREASNSLRYLIEIPQSQLEKTSLPVFIGTTKLDSMLVKSRGWVTCKQNGKCGKAVGDILDNAEESIKHGGIYLNAINAELNEQAINPLAAASVPKKTWTLFIIDKECHDCCARSAIQVGRPDGHQFCFLRIIS
jgi:hypothetical protein